MGGSDQVERTVVRMTPVPEPLAVARGTGLVAALTFDDGPNPGETERLLDVLGTHGLVATFCVVGDAIRAPRGAEVLRRIAGDGHTLCNHATSWADMVDWSPERVADDLLATLAIIRDALGDPAAPAGSGVRRSRPWRPSCPSTSPPAGASHCRSSGAERPSRPSRFGRYGLSGRCAACR